MTIRELISDDLDDLSLVLSDPEIMQFSTVGVHTRTQLLDYIQICAEQYKTQQYGRWGIFNTFNDEFIGLCGLTLEDDGHVHINYRLASKSHGKGFATETVVGLLEYAKNTLNAKTVTASIEPDNVSSIKVVERVGFLLEGQSTFRGLNVNIYRVKI